MASTPIAGVRVDPSLPREIAEAHGLTGMTISEIVRFALALAAGRPDPIATARVKRGPKARA